MAYFVLGTTPRGRMFYVGENQMCGNLLMLTYVPDKALSKEQAEALLAKARASASTATYEIIEE